MHDWERAESLFLAAADLPLAERNAFLDTECGADRDLRAEIEELLEADTRQGEDILAAIEGHAQSLFAPESVAGTRFGSYRLIREIGRGGMSTVYLAVRDDEQFEKQVAIKLIRRGMDTDDVLGRFRGERQILANLEHAYIGRLLDGGTSDDGRPFLVMEYVQGEPLDVYCDRVGLDLRERCRLFLKVCEAVSCAHRNLVVHRDLKPGNILVGSDGAPKLLDFGVAKLLDPDEGPGLTMTGVAGRMLTPEYASPEQLRGERITTASDVYSLGAVLYQLLSGARPHQFKGTGFREYERVICETEPQRMSDAAKRWNGQLRGDFDAIVAKAMRKEPELRYASVDQFSIDIERSLDGFPVAARQGDKTYRAGKFLKRNRTALAAGALFVGALAAGAVAATIQARRAEAARQVALANQKLAERNGLEARRQAAESERQRKQAEIERAAVETQRQLADRRFEQLRQLAGKFLFDFHDQIVNLPGSTPARKQVVETGLRYYDSLVAEAQGNRVLLEEAARGYERLGDVQGNPYMSNLGDYKGALASYQKARAIRAGISDSSAAFMRDRISGETKIAEVLMTMGQAKEADMILRAIQRIAEASPVADDPEVIHVLMATYGALGDLKVHSGLYGEVEEPYTKLIALAKRLDAVGPDHGLAQYALAMGHTKLADAYSHMERAAEALTHMRAALEIDRKLLAATPDDRNRQRKLYLDHHIMGIIYLSDSGKTLDKGGEALANMQKAADLAEEMLHSDPNDERARNDVRNVQELLGDVLRDDHQAEAALTHYQRGFDIAEKQQASAGANNLTMRENLMMAHHRMARGLIDAGRPSPALEHLDQAMAVLADLIQREGTKVRWTSWTTDLERARGLAYAGLKNWPEAIAAYHRAIAAATQTSKADPKNDDYWNDLRHGYLELADCYAAAGQTAEAAATMQDLLNTLQQIEGRRSLRADEMESRNSAVAKMTAWRK
jgi:tetratricopeptide (TPR) repeat protein